MLGAAALTMGAGAASADDPIVADGVTVPTQAQCQSGWNDSSAADTCGAAVTSNYYGSFPAATVTVWTGGEERRDEKGKWYWLITEAGCRVQVKCMPTGAGPANSRRGHRADGGTGGGGTGREGKMVLAHYRSRMPGAGEMHADGGGAGQ